MVRSERCSEKVDVWSYGVVLWELLTCEIPYKDVSQSAVLYGVGKSCLTLPVPSTCPPGFNLLLNQCWAPKPSNRPSFRHILMHLDIAAVEILSLPFQEFHRTQENWREEIGANLADTQVRHRCLILFPTSST
jgi:mitogen-activated protein kinase kinase kinase 13